jgi:hypothetical protein
MGGRSTMSDDRSRVPVVKKPDALAVAITDSDRKQVAEYNTCLNELNKLIQAISMHNLNNGVYPHLDGSTAIRVLRATRNMMLDVVRSGK